VVGGGLSGVVGTGILAGVLAIGHLDMRPLFVALISMMVASALAVWLAPRWRRPRSSTLEREEQSHS
jgi:hypothetical protein